MLRIRLIHVLAVSMGLGAASSAVADVGPYAGLEGGWSTNLDTRLESPGVSAKVQFHDGYVYGGTIGYALPGHLRPELAVDYRRHTLKDADGAESAITMMGNLWYDFETRSNYFYFGGGVGDAHLKLTLGQAGSSDDVFAYQFGAGAGYLVSHHVYVGVDYRYLASASRASFSYSGLGTKARYRSQVVMIGVRYNFGGFWDPFNPRTSERPVRVVPLADGD